MLANRASQRRFEDCERYLAAARDAARRAAALTHRLLAFSRQQTLAPSPTDVNLLVADMLELVRRSSGPDTEIVFEGAPDLWPVLVDGPQLENALLNLCINARDAMPAGGRITITTRNLWPTPGDSDGEEGLCGPCVCLSVADTGHGMSPEVMARAFDPFFTTKPLGKGTGLGLSMIYGFARQSGGQARLQSEVGRGATVSILLPRHDGEITSPSTAASVPAPRAAYEGRVLVVDDEPTVRMLIVDVVKGLGLDVLEAADGAGGLSALRTMDHVDLLITDVGMPGGMSGQELVAAVREERPGLRVLFVSGFSQAAITSSAGFDANTFLLAKPFQLQDLASRVGALLDADLS
jgi:CheY-like chemotaxis protein